jgi:hypothetical protein
MYGPGPYPVHPEVFARPELQGPPYLRTRQAHPATLHIQARPAVPPSASSSGPPLPARPAANGQGSLLAGQPVHWVAAGPGSGPVGRAGRAELVSAGDAVLRRALAALQHGRGGRHGAAGVEVEGRAALAMVRSAGRLYRDAAEGLAR